MQGRTNENEPGATRRALMKGLAAGGLGGAAAGGPQAPLVGKKHVVAGQGCHVDVTGFGAFGNGVVDDTAAIQAAIDHVASTSIEQRGGTVCFPPGLYPCAELVWKRGVSLVGQSTGTTLLRYNGAGGTGSHVLRADDGPSYFGLRHLALIGSNDLVNGPFADHCLVLGPSSHVDNQALFFDVQFAHSLFNAVHMESEWTNFHMDTVRFDGVGGYCVRLRTGELQDVRPFSMRKFTVDNTPAPGNDAAGDWGLGLVRVVGTHTVSPAMLRFDTGRLEFNRFLRGDEYGDHALGEPVGAIYLEEGSGGTFALSHDSVYVTKLPLDGAYVYGERRSRNLFTNVTFGTGAGAFLYRDPPSVRGARRTEVPAQNYAFSKVEDLNGQGAPGVSVTKNEPQTIAPSQVVQLEFNAIHVDENAEWDENGHFWECRVPGRYLVTARARIGALAVGKIFSGRIFLDDELFAVNATTSGGESFTYVQVSTYAIFPAGARIDFRVFHDDAQARDVAGASADNQLFVMHQP